jgi:hypothetical protein
MIERWTVPILRLFLAVLFAVLVVLETVSLPGQLAHEAKESPDSAELRWPFTIAAVLIVVCAQVVVVATWRLLSLVRQDRIFSDASRTWVDAILWAMGVGWVLLVAMFLVIGFRADDPGLPLLMFLLVVGGAVLGLLMVVMRELLRRATTLRTEMETVI